MSSISEGTHRQYAKPLKEWATFCVENEYEVLVPEPHQVIEFLNRKFQQGVKAGTLNTYRSALSFVLGEKATRDPWVQRFLKGCYNLRPARPRYDRIYDIDPVLHMIEELYPLEKLSLENLTLRLAILLAIVTAHRKQTLALITIDNIKRTKDGFEIEIPDKIKTSRARAYQPLLHLPRFDDKQKLCAARTLERYLHVTEALRGQISSLFLTTTKPFKAATRDTISNWLRKGLKRAGITEEFAPHSLRHASTSTAFRRGVNISLIKNLAGWSEKSTSFDRFYNRPIISNKLDFAKAVLL